MKTKAGYIMNKRYLLISAVCVLLCCSNLFAENIDPYENGSQHAYGRKRRLGEF